MISTTGEYVDCPREEKKNMKTSELLRHGRPFSIECDDNYYHKQLEQKKIIKMIQC